jgi:hypothetical protein
MQRPDMLLVVIQAETHIKRCYNGLLYKHIRNRRQLKHWSCFRMKKGGESSNSFVSCFVSKANFTACRITLHSVTDQNEIITKSETKKDLR